MKLRLALITAAAVVVVASVVIGGVALAAWPGQSREAAATQATTAPAWFGPIWDYYDRDPAVTPSFDFASLYSGPPGRMHTGRSANDPERS